jgi:cobyric acid synthase
MDPLPNRLQSLDDGSADGIRFDRMVGTYLHGAFEDAGVLAEFGITCEEEADRGYDRLADWFEPFGARFDELFLRGVIANARSHRCPKA